MKFPRIFVFLDNTKRWALVIPVLIIGYWAYDRTDSPFDILEEPGIQVAYAGDEITFSSKVRREVSRKCSAVLNRFIVDSNGVRTDFDKDQSFSIGALEKLEKAAPGQSSFRFRIPPTMPSGPASVITSIQYKCLTNPLTYVLPIGLSREWKFYVLVPVPKEK